MYVFELIKPGTCLASPDDPRVRFTVEALLGLLGDCLADAAISLTLFESSCALNRESRAGGARTKTEWPVSSGSVPASYSHRLPFIHAKSCVFALDSIAKTIRQLSRQDAAPADVAASYDELVKFLPALQDVRDSAHHPEDRIRGVQRSNMPLVLKAVDNRFMKAPAGVAVIVDALVGNRYGGTMASGEYGEVEISAASVTAARDAIQRAYLAYPWKGPGCLLPYRASEAWNPPPP